MQTGVIGINPVKWPVVASELQLQATHKSATSALRTLSRVASLRFGHDIFIFGECVNKPRSWLMVLPGTVELLF